MCLGCTRTQGGTTSPVGCCRCATWQVSPQCAHAGERFGCAFGALCTAVRAASASGLRVIQRLRQKLLDEEAYARRHRLGVWREHVEAEVVPTGVRAMMKAVRRVFNRVLGRGGTADDALRATPPAAPTGVNSTGEALTNSDVGDGSSKPGHGTGDSGEAQPQPSASNTQEHSGSGASSERVGSSRSDGPRAVGGGEVRAVVKQAAKQAVASSVSGPSSPSST